MLAVLVHKSRLNAGHEPAHTGKIVRVKVVAEKVRNGRRFRESVGLVDPAANTVSYGVGKGLTQRCCAADKLLNVLLDVGVLVYQRRLGKKHCNRRDNMEKVDFKLACFL